MRGLNSLFASLPRFHLKHEVVKKKTMCSQWVYLIITILQDLVIKNKDGECVFVLDKNPETLGALISKLFDNCITFKK